MRKAWTLNGRRRSDVKARSGTGAWFCSPSHENKHRKPRTTSPNTIALRGRPASVSPSLGLHVAKVRPARNRRLSKRERKAERRARQRAAVAAAERSLAARGER